MKIWYNELFNEYTVIIGNNIYIMDNPLSPQGINQYVGEKSELILHKEDKPIEFENCPDDVKKAIIQRRNDGN